MAINRDQVRVGLCGLGTVGAGTWKVLQRNAVEIAARAGLPVVITHVGARRDHPDCELSGVRVSRDVFAVVNDPDVDIVVELIGGTTVAKDLIERALEQGKHVVTANKALIAEYGNSLFAQANARGLALRYEAAVAGGIPVIKALREGLAGNRIEWLAGIINGTGNFILTEMRDKGRAFDDVLKEAQQLGYAEADPTFDIEGIDAAHKLVILASLAFGIPLQYDRVFTEGITRLTTEDMRFAEELGYRIKHLGIARRRDNGIELRVHPTLIPEKRLIANVNGVMNAVLIEADAVGPTLYYGAGAGAEPTASAVVADIIDAARSIATPLAQQVPALGFQASELTDPVVLSSDEFESAWYLRLATDDKPGVLSAISRILSDRGISIEAMIQREPASGEKQVPIVMLTTVTREGIMREAVKAIEALPTTLGPLTTIRMETLAG